MKHYLLSCLMMFVALQMQATDIIFGNCHYKDSNLEVEYISKLGDNYLFRAKNRCVDCGKPYEALFQVTEAKFDLVREVST